LLLTACAAALATATVPSAARAAGAPPVPVVASFSILGDIVREVGGDRVALTVLVGPGADAHVYQPTPAQARTVAQARVLFSIGLGFEGWLTRFLRAAGFEGRHVVVADGLPRLHAEGGRSHAGHHHHHDVDPHVWQNVAHAVAITARVAEALCVADPGGCGGHRERAAAYTARLQALDREIRDAWASVPPQRRTIITSHEAFGHYGAAYGVRFLSPQGISTEAEASARGVAALVRQVRAEGATALFVENVADPRLIEQIARETGLRPSGRLYADSLTGPDGAAPDYLTMMRHNTGRMVEALR
jgi:zinc/manganese transport system substrate-binding protein